MEALTITGMDPLDLDVSGCASLKRISCHYALKTLNASGCHALETLCHTGYDPDQYLFGSYLTRLDLTDCRSLKKLEIHTTKSDGLARFSVAGCSSLEALNCTGCGLTALDLSGCTALRELNCEENPLTRLNVTDCAALEKLWCSSDQLKSLDVSQNANLKQLNVSASIKALDLSANKKLEVLHCTSERLTALDLSGHKKLKTASCNGSRMSQLKLDGCTGLTYLNCPGALTQLDLSSCTALEELSCIGNRLKTLDITHNKKLFKIQCWDNQLTTLDLTGTPELLWLLENAKLSRYIWCSCSKTVGDKYYYLCCDKDVELITEHVPIRRAAITVEDAVYTGKARKGAVTVTLDGAALEKGKDYTVAYADNVAVGKATVKITGMGRYTGSVKKTFNINPKKVTGLKLQAGKAQLTTSWNKASGVSGYQLQYGLKPDFKGAKAVTVKKAAVKKTIDGLKSGKTYCVRIRCYKEVNGRKYWSAWSNAVKKKAK